MFDRERGAEGEGHLETKHGIRCAYRPHDEGASGISLFDPDEVTETGLFSVDPTHIRVLQRQYVLLQIGDLEFRSRGTALELYPLLTQNPVFRKWVHREEPRGT